MLQNNNLFFLTLILVSMGTVQRGDDASSATLYIAH